MPNQLHAMLSAGFIQASPVIGEAFVYLANNYTGFFSPADERLLVEIVGYIDESDTICVVSVDQFVALGASVPTVKTAIARNGDTYSIRGIKTDQSAYLLALKKISA